MATAPTKQIEELLECSICTETLAEPRTLSCFHSFCKHCLANFVATKKAVKKRAKVPEVFECPVCRSEFHVKEGESIENMPSNHFINNMLELLNLTQESENISCQSCKARNPAISRCVSCENYLCKKCLEVHNNWPAFEDHVVLTLEELAKPENRAKAKGKPRCEKHNKVLKFYCETCKVLACRYCVDVNHARLQHLWFPVEDVIVQHKKAFVARSAIFEQQVNEAAQSSLNIKHAISSLLCNAAKAKDAIIQQQQEILSTFTRKLKQETVALLDQVDIKYKEANEPLMKQQDDVKDYLEKAKSFFDFVKYIISNGSNEELLSFEHEVEEKARTIENERPEFMEPAHSGSIEYQANQGKDVLKDVRLNNLGKIVCPGLLKVPLLGLEAVLLKNHNVKEHKLEISNKPARTKSIPKKRKRMPVFKREEEVNKTQTDNERAYLGEVRTVIVTGLSPQTTDQVVLLFFENDRRTGGGEIENMERCQPDVAHITFVKAEVATRVLKNVKLELEGYLLQLTEEQPELFLPKDRKRLYVENINPNTTKDSLMNYMEVRTNKEVHEVQFGDNGNALLIFNEEPDINKVMENKKLLEGAALKISNPPVYNSILITGLTTRTTKDTIEMYFENEKNGGGKIYGDVIYQKEKGMAVVSFCDPEVLKTLLDREHKLNESVLSVRQHYQFMRAITETAYCTIKLNSDVLDHVIKKCEEEIAAQFGAKTLEIIQEKKEEFLFPEAIVKDIQEYMEQFTVKEIPFCKKLLDAARDELSMMLATANKGNITATMEEELLQIKIVGAKKCANEIYKHFRNKISEMEKGLDIAFESNRTQAGAIPASWFWRHARR